MRTYTRNPRWTVTIRRPDYTRSTLSYKGVPEWSDEGYSQNAVNFVSSQAQVNGTQNYGDLISYEYDSSLRNPANPFSLTLVPRLDSNNRTWKDKIKARDIVFISEFGKLRYIGIVKGTGYTSNINNERPTRSIVVNGESIGGMLQSFNLPMNIYLWFSNGSDAEEANRSFINSLNSNLDENQSIGKMFSLIKDGFLKVNFGSSLSTSGFATVMDSFFNLNSENLVAFYPMNLKPFQTESNTLWSIFRQILPEPVYEIFGRFENGKYNLICRETPFDAVDWNALKITTLDPLFLIEQNLNDTDEEVYTHFFSSMPNSAFSPNEIYANNSLSEVSVFDTEKLPIYGYRQLEATFPFFDLDKGKEFSAIDFLKKNSVRLFAWYKNNVDFQSGQITLHTVPDEDNNYINVGERIQYLKGTGTSIEFYVENIKRKMSYPETMTSTYSVTRGYEYSKTSTIIKVGAVSVESPQAQRIQNLGVKLVQSEKVEGQE